MVKKKATCKGAPLRAAKKAAETDTEKIEPETIVQNHRRLWAEIKSRLSESLKEGAKEDPFEELRFVKTAGETLSNIVKGERLAWGVDEVSPESDANDRDAVAEEMAESTVSSGADKTLEG
ncbi:MAG: hypothetical protein HY880_08390 [Deltaproteobacteria bacterium]|nr:hypothetical protein [Deltaproteobacteria bacterium]